MIESFDVLNILLQEKGFAMTNHISKNYFRFTNGNKEYVAFIDGDHLILSDFNHYRTRGMLSINFTEPDSLNRLQKFIEQ